MRFIITPLQKHKLLTLKFNEFEIGYCNFDINENKIFINYIWVDHNYRRNGYGLQMLKYIEFKYNKNIEGDFITPNGILLWKKYSSI